MISRIDTVVVGAGPAGLAASAALADAGHPHVVLERGRVGETWRTQRWDGFRLNTPGWMSTIPGDPDRFHTGAELVGTLEERAARLPVHEHTGVRGVWRERTGGYVVATEEHVLRCDTVVAASGAQRVPHLPGVAYRVSGHGIEHLHTADYRNADELPPGGVLVVGGAQSGVQIAADLERAGRRVLLATSQVPGVPRRYRGRDICEWWQEMGHLDLPAEEADEAMRGKPNPHLGAGEELTLDTLAARGVRLLGGLVDASGTRLSFDGAADEHVAFARDVRRRWRAKVDGHIALHGIDAPAPDAVPDPVDAPAGSVAGGPHTLDLRAAGIGTVIWATGFRGDFGWLRMPILTPEGRPIGRGVATASAGLYVLGVPWLTHRASGTLYGVVRDAGEIARHITLGARVATSV